MSAPAKRAYSNIEARELVSACYCGELAVVESLVQQLDPNVLEVELSIQTKWGQKTRTALTAACSTGQLETTKFLLDSGAAVNQCISPIKVHPLLLACQDGHLTVASLLIQYKADVNAETYMAENQQRVTALTMAVQDGHQDTARLLLSHSAMFIPKNTEQSLLNVACITNHPGVVQLLLDHQHDPAVVSGPDSQTALHCSVLGWRPLSTAGTPPAQRGSLECTKLLLGTGIDPDVPDSKGITALMHLCNGDAHWLSQRLLQADLRIVQALMDAGADVNLSGESQLFMQNVNVPLAALGRAAVSGQFELVRLLVCQGALVKPRAELVVLQMVETREFELIKAILSVAPQLSRLMLAVVDRDLQAVERLLCIWGNEPKHVVHIDGTSYSANTLLEDNLPWSKPVCEEVTKMLRRASSWSPKSHMLFPIEFRKVVKQILMLQVALESSQLPRLPQIVWDKVIAHLPRNYKLII